MIALGVEDLERSKAFYAMGMKLPCIDSPPSVVFFNLNGTWLGLSERDNLAADADLTPTDAQHSGINLVHNVATEDEVDSVMKMAIDSGGKVVKSPTKADWGGYHGYFSDPDGHLWEVAHNPFVWIGPSDD